MQRTGTRERAYGSRTGQRPLARTRTPTAAAAPSANTLHQQTIPAFAKSSIPAQQMQCIGTREQACGSRTGQSPLAEHAQDPTQPRSIAWGGGGEAAMKGGAPCFLRDGPCAGRVTGTVVIGGPVEKTACHAPCWHTLARTISSAGALASLRSRRCGGQHQLLALRARCQRARANRVCTGGANNSVRVGRQVHLYGSDTPVGFFKVTWVACGGQKQVPSVGERQVFHVSEWITANTSKFGRYTPLAAGILSRLEVWPDTLFEERPRPSRPRPHALQRHPLYLSHPRWFGGFASLWEPSARQEPMPRGIVQPTSSTSRA